MSELRDRLLQAPDEIDRRNLPPHFERARAAIRKSLSRLGRGNVSDETLIAVLMSETLPRMMDLRGPAWTAALLVRLGQDIGAGIPAGTARQ